MPLLDETITTAATPTAGATTGDTTPGTPTTNASPAPGVISAPYSDPNVYNRSVAGHVEGLLKSDNPLMKVAETQALQRANQRGLLNSSMAVGAAQEAMTKAATPIAAQDAGHQQRLYETGYSTAANLQGQLGQHVGQIQSNTTQAIASVMMQPNIDPSTKQTMIRDLQRQRDADLKFINSVYGQLPAWEASWQIIGGPTAPPPIVGDVLPGVSAGAPSTPQFTPPSTTRSSSVGRGIGGLPVRVGPGHRSDEVGR